MHKARALPVVVFAAAWLLGGCPFTPFPQPLDGVWQLDAVYYDSTPPIGALTIVNGQPVTLRATSGETTVEIPFNTDLTLTDLGGWAIPGMPDFSGMPDMLLGLVTVRANGAITQTGDAFHMEWSFVVNAGIIGLSYPVEGLTFDGTLLSANEITGTAVTTGTTGSPVSMQFRMTR